MLQSIFLLWDDDATTRRVVNILTDSFRLRRSGVQKGTEKKLSTESFFRVRRRNVEMICCGRCGVGSF